MPLMQSLGYAVVATQVNGIHIHIAVIQLNSLLMWQPHLHSYLRHIVPHHCQRDFAVMDWTLHSATASQLSHFSSLIT